MRTAGAWGGSCVAHGAGGADAGDCLLIRLVVDMRVRGRVWSQVWEMLGVTIGTCRRELKLTAASEKTVGETLAKGCDIGEKLSRLAR